MIKLVRGKLIKSGGATYSLRNTLVKFLNLKKYIPLEIVKNKFSDMDEYSKSSEYENMKYLLKQLNKKERRVAFYFVECGYMVNTGRKEAKNRKINSVGVPDLYLERLDEELWVEIKLNEDSLTAPQIEWFIKNPNLLKMIVFVEIN